MNGMGGVDPMRREKNAEAALMRDGARKWILRAGRDLREIPAPALLAMLCAAAFSPLMVVGAGITGAAAVAGMGVLSSVGGGVLADVITKAIDRLRRQHAEGSPLPSDIEEVLASEIDKVLAAGTADASAMRAEIGKVLEGIDLGGAILRDAIDSGNEQLRSDLITAISVLGSDFTELHFLVSDVAAAAARIQQDLDEQRANTRVIIEQNAGQSVEIRRAREDLAVIERRTRPWIRRDEGALDTVVRWEGCPYRGLLPFGEADAEIFYGRERLTTDLAVMVAGQTSHSGLIVVTGASGAGKSSLLRAGLLPALARGLQVRGSERWPCRVMTPTKEPLTELAIQLAAVGGGNALTIADALAKDPGHAHLAARQAVLARTALHGRPLAASDSTLRLVLIVDQFEQVFTLNANEDRDTERKRFITALCAMTTNPAGDAQEPPALVVVAVRGDFLDRCAAYAELAVAMQERQFVVGPMTDSDLRLAITGPADAAGLRLEPSLAETILGDLRAAGTDTAVGVLPLLSQAMLLTWENRDGDRLTSHGYGQSGGISRAIEISADAVYDDLPASSQVVAREILRNMTTTSRGARLSRRPATRASLYALPGVRPLQADAILEKFAAKRLIVLNEGTAEIAHDALLTAWPRLRGWLEEDLASWSLHSQLADDAEEWARGRQPDFLYRGIQLADAQRMTSIWAANPDRYPALTVTEREFLQASERANERRVRQRWAAVAALLILLLASLTGAGLAAAAAKSADYQRNNANYQSKLAASNELAAESEQRDVTDLPTAAQLAAASWEDLPTAQARVSMLEVLARGETATFDADTNHDLASTSVFTVAFSPGGSIFATGEADGTARLWDVATHKQIGAPITADGHNHGYGVTTVAFSPDGKILATGADDGTARLWDVATHQQIGASITTVAGVTVAFSPDGKILATAGGDGIARLWDVATHQQIGAPMTAVSDPNVNDGVGAVVFSPDGSILATLGLDGTARLWDVATHQQIGAPINTSSGVGADVVAFSPNGKILATAGADGAVRLWDVATHQLIGAPITAVSDPSTNDVDGLAFSPDGSIFATGGDDGTVRLWNVATHQQIGAPITAYSDPIVNGGVDAVAFSPDGKTLATGGDDGTARLWSVSFYGQIGAPITADSDPGDNGLAAVAVSPDGKVFATGGGDGTARLFDVATHQEIGAPITVVSDPTDSIGVAAVAFSPDGKVLATGGGDGTARLWNVATHQQIGAPITADPGPDGGVNAVAFSLDGKVLATAGDDGTARLWDVATHRQIGAPFGTVSDSSANGVNAVAFSPDGKVLVTGGSDGAARLWDVASHQQIGAPINAVSSNVVATVAFSPDGEILATGGDDGTARLWDVATHQQIGASFTAVSSLSTLDSVQAVAFSPDGSILVTGGGDGTARLWNVEFPADLLRAVCAVAGTSLTPQQWTLYGQSGPYQEICP
jgi:WD40 repeat protein